MPISTYNRGVIAAVVAYTYWSLIPVYWKLLVGIRAEELLYTRLLLTFLTCLILLPLRGTFRTFLAAWRDPVIIRQRLLAAVLISGNWFSFMWSVVNDRVMESSLGYFLCPLVSVLLGRFIEKEHLGFSRWLAVGFAAIGVGFIVSGANHFPYAGIVIAFTWAGYGLAKKRSQQGPLVGLGMEVGLLAPLAAALFLWTAWRQPLTLAEVDGATLGFLSLVGVVTVLPLILFAYAAQRIRLSTMGMGQYIVPSVFFVLAIFYGEPVTPPLLAGFAFIWVGLALYAFSARRTNPVDDSVEA
ncbi:MAG: EamA family transporter RarD [Puniceicoccaceae bacterium]